MFKVQVFQEGHKISNFCGLFKMSELYIPATIMSLRVGSVSIDPMNFNEKYFREEIDSEEH